MKKLTFLLLLALTNFCWSQNTNPFAPKTGDTEMDKFLHQVNTDAQKDAGAFTSMITNTFKIAKTDVEKLLVNMVPGDVYMAAQVASTINKPVMDVSSTYMKNKDKGWGQIAKEMGIKPGSPEFHKLKNSMKKPGGGGEGSEEHGKGNGHGNGHGHGKK